MLFGKDSNSKVLYYLSLEQVMWFWCVQYSQHSVTVTLAPFTARICLGCGKTIRVKKLSDFKNTSCGSFLLCLTCRYYHLHLLPIHLESAYGLDSSMFSEDDKLLRKIMTLVLDTVRRSTVCRLDFWHGGHPAKLI